MAATNEQLHEAATLGSIGMLYGWNIHYLEANPTLYKLVQKAIGDGSGSTTTIAQFQSSLAGTQWASAQPGSQPTNVQIGTPSNAPAAAPLPPNAVAPGPAAAASGQSVTVTGGATGSDYSKYLAANGGAATASPFANLTTYSADPNLILQSKVYTDSGLQAVHGLAGHSHDSDTAGSNPTQTSVGAYMENVFTMSKDQIEAIQRSLVGLGMLPPAFIQSGLYGTFDQQSQSALRGLLYNVSQYNDPNVTITDQLAKGQQGYDAGVRNKSSTISTTDVQYTNQADAQGIANKAAIALLGRDASPGEVSKVYAALTASEKANPLTVNKTVGTQVDPSTGSYQVTNETQTGGMSGSTALNSPLDTIAKEQVAQSAPDFHAMQAVNFANVLASMAGAVNNAGASVGGA